MLVHISILLSFISLNFISNIGFAMDHSHSHSPLLVGTNLWQAIVWASKNDDEHLERLKRELDYLKKNNVSFVRIMASIQKHDSPYSIKEPCQVNKDDSGINCLKSLNIVLDELKKREMKAIVVFNNFWHWSGGFNSYMAWTKEGPYADFGPTANFLTMTKFFIQSARFFKSPKANKLYDNFIKLFFNFFPNGHPAIMSYQLANEPTPFFNQRAFYQWVKEKTNLIKTFDSKTPLTLGGIGTGPTSFGTGMNLKKIHRENNFDYLTVHIWPQNWLWYDPHKTSEAHFQKMLNKTRKYLLENAVIAKESGSPMLVEEFGLARDKEQLDRDTPVTLRNRFYQFIVDELNSLKRRGYPVAGLAFWAWGGEGIPQKNLVGDPPHEKQGWYSIYDSDYSTLEIIKNINK
jgi:mannan endo-1,4-beta-mannosidase